ncbi:MAG: MnhB domain-containing protein [Verrucomicrobiales bacterium]|nr:MnhB domain-containing protein [Verrucomicrobiales bacterium]
MINPRSFIFTSVAKALFFLLNLFALYLLLRGHHLPGGGFIAGLVTAISIVLLTLALGWEQIHRLLRLDPAWLAIAGLLLASGSGAAPLLWGRPFLEQFMVQVSVPWLGVVHVGTPLVFDAGVLLVVGGMTCKILFVLGKSTEGLRALVKEEEARYASPVEEPIEAEQPQFEDASERAEAGRLDGKEEDDATG